MTYLISFDIQYLRHVFMNYKFVPSQIKYKTTFVMPKTLPKSALPIPERSAPVSFDNFINAVNIAKV